jgi:hypothetical protein
MPVHPGGFARFVFRIVLDVRGLVSARVSSQPGIN